MDGKAPAEDGGIWITGRNPVLEALQAGLRAEELVLRRGSTGAQPDKARRMAQVRHIPLRELEEGEMDRLLKSPEHRGMALRLVLPQPLDWDAFLARHHEQGRQFADLCLVLLDGIQDPHNLGAILRTAHSAGVDAVILPEKGVAPLSAAVFRVSAGALAWQTLVRVPDAAWLLDRLQPLGCLRIGLDSRGARTLKSTPLTRPVCLVLGGEGRGLAHRVQERLDLAVRIPMHGKVDSLNVSVAAGIVIYHFIPDERDPEHE
jgi:23S rRNA (guanosine2251-2'-O)-methyltransferase